MSVRRGVWCASAVLLSSGCGLLSAQADPAEPSAAPPISTSTTTPSSTPGAPAGAAADLVASLDGRPARLSVTPGHLVQGVPPLLTPDGTVADDCGLTDDSTQYATATVVFTALADATKQTGVSSNLRLDVSVPDGDGVFVESTRPTSGCASGAGLPARATLQTQDLADEHQTLTVYVVARSGGLQGVALRLQNPRHHADDIDGRAWSWTVARVTAGAACDGDPDSLCVPMP